MLKLDKGQNSVLQVKYGKEISQVYLRQLPSLSYTVKSIDFKGSLLTVSLQ